MRCVSSTDCTICIYTYIQDKQSGVGYTYVCAGYVTGFTCTIQPYIYIQRGKVVEYKASSNTLLQMDNSKHRIGPIRGCRGESMRIDP